MMIVENRAQKQCQCRPFCGGQKYCGAKFNTLIVHKDEVGIPRWFIQKNIDSTSPRWEQIIHSPRGYDSKDNG